MALLDSVLGHGERPSRHARMTERGAAKYFTVHKALGERQLADHLAGKATYGAPLIGRDGLAGAGVIELDVGAEVAALRALDALAAIGVTAFSFVTPGSGGHDGSHTWVLYRARGDPEHIRAQLRQAAESAHLPAREIFPTNQAIRLPFGLHRRTRRRGVLLLQDGRRFDLDRGGLPEAMAAVAALPRSALPPPALQRPPPRPAERYSPPSSGQVIGDFCRATDLVDLLASYPGYTVVLRTVGGAVLRCGCPHHKHGDRRPSLEVKAGRDGRQVAIGYAPSCIWHNERGRNDAFNVLCELERLSPRDAVRRLARPAPSPQPRYPPHPAEAPALEQPGPDEAALAARRRDAERKRERRRAEVRSVRSAVEARLAGDTALSERGATVLRALLDVAGERDWCRPSVARLVELTGYAERTVQYALVDLERAGYIRSMPVRAGTTYRHLLAPVETSRTGQADQAVAVAPVEASGERDRWGPAPPPVSPSHSGAFAPIETSESAEEAQVAPLAPIGISSGDERGDFVAQPDAQESRSFSVGPFAPVEMSTLQAGEPAAEAAPIQASARAAVAPESKGESESGYKLNASEKGVAGLPGGAAGTTSSKPGRRPRASRPAKPPLWGASARPAKTTRAKGKRGGLPRRAWAGADMPALEQELRRLRAMLGHMPRGPARSAVDRAAHRLGELIAARRDIGVAVMCYSNQAEPPQVHHPHYVAEGPAVAFESGASFVPQGANAAALLAKLRLAPAGEELGAPSPHRSQAAGLTPTASSPTASGPLPPGWAVERCDHKGNLTAYGCYWRARGPTGDTEPTMYLDTACWQARRAAEAAGRAGGSNE